ncbi:hypothetical protein VPH35_017841 [Triticum aestivum]
MEVLVLLIVLLYTTIVLWQRTTRSRAQTTIHKVDDTVATQHTLNEKASVFPNCLVAIFPVVLATGLRGKRNENITMVKYAPPPIGVCSDATSSPRASTLRASVPLPDATRGHNWSGRGRRGARRPWPHQCRWFALLARLCFGDGVDRRHVCAMELVIHYFIISMGELRGPQSHGTMLCKLVNWRLLGRLFSFVGRQTKLFLPLINERRRLESRACTAGGGVQPYVDSLLDLRVADNDASGKQGKDVRCEVWDDELVCLVLEFLGAGSGSVVTSLEWTLGHLVDQLDVQDNPHREIIDGQTSNGGVPPHARMHPPGLFIMRGFHGKGTVVIGSITMAAMPAGGMRVQFIVGDIGRDSKTWTNPDEFRSERFHAGGKGEGIGPTPGPKEIRMMPFGAAYRHCPGSSQAMVHIKFLAALVREFECAPLAENCSVDLVELDGLFKVMKKLLSARVKKHTQSM